MSVLLLAAGSAAGKGRGLLGFGTGPVFVGGTGWAATIPVAASKASTAPVARIPDPRDVAPADMPLLYVRTGAPPITASGGCDRSNMADEFAKTLERYDVVDRIAVGGMAEVFLAKAYGAHGFEKTLAIKRILPDLARDPEFEQRFIAEA